MWWWWHRPLLGLTTAESHPNRQQVTFARWVVTEQTTENYSTCHHQAFKPAMNPSEHPFNPGRVIPTMMLMLRSCQSSIPKKHVWMQNTFTKQWYKAFVNSKAETPRSYVVSTPDGDKRRKRIHLKDAGIPKVVSNAQPNPQGSVPRESPSVLVALKQPEGNGLPKYVLRSVPNPSCCCPK